MAHHLTARNVLTLPVPTPAQRQIDYWDSTMTGFGVRVSYGGQRAWVVRYTVEGTKRRRRMTFDSTETLSLADARRKAKRAQNEAARGIDPAAILQQREEAGTIGELCADFMRRRGRPDAAATDPAAATVAPETATEPAKPRARRGGRKKRSWKEDRRIIENELLSPRRANWRHVKVTDLTRSMVQDLFDAITDRGAPVMANRTLALVSTLLNHALTLGWVQANVAARIDKNDEESRARVLTDDEIRELWTALGETERTNDDGRQLARLNTTLNHAFKMAFYTIQRGRAEVFRMRWPDVDLVEGLWEIPAEHSKNKLTHVVPLSAAAVELLAGRLAVARPDAVWAFENVQPSKRGRKNFGNVAARGKKAAAFLSRGDAHLKNKRARTRKRLPFLPGLSFRFQLHDLRRTGSTNTTKSGIRRADVSKVLNHVDRGPRSTKVYDRYEYLPEKRAAIEAWARKLDAILNGVKPAAVLPFAQAAR